MREKEPILEFKQVSFCYPQTTSPALKDVSFSVFSSEIVVLCGQSGCGKSTLLRHMKKNQIPFGSGEGEILYCGTDLEQMTDRESAEKIGFVGQNPESQIVTDKVWHELAFGLENIGVSRNEIRKRTAEIAEYFGMGSWFHRSVHELSGGQKQILNLASVMIMRPELLILDEPTSQLDPIGAKRFIQTLLWLNQDLGTTIILSEQRLEEVLPVADRVLLMHEGQLLGDGTVRECASLLEQAELKTGSPLPIEEGMPVALRVYRSSGEKRTQGEIPVSVRQGKEWLREYAKKGRIVRTAAGRVEKDGHAGNKPDIVLRAAGVSYGYEKGKTILEDFELAVERGSFYAVLGGNGSGKTTALKVLSGIYKPSRGKIRRQGKVCYLAQNPQSVFSEITVVDELADMLPESKARKEKVERMLEWLELVPQRKQNPMDLSGGQQQRLALGKILLLEPDVILLDEPTKGMDAAFKRKLSQNLAQLCGQGVTLIMVSHDLEFCAENATHCGLLFDGQIISSGPVREFFEENSFYTTAVSRMTKGIVEHCVLFEDIVKRMER